MQTHIGLPSYVAGQKTVYSDGKGFIAAKTPLFPQEEEGQEYIRGGNSPVGAAEQLRHETGGWGSQEAPESQGRDATLNQKLQQAHEEMSARNGGWHDAVLVDGLGWARVRRHPTRRYRTTESLLIPKEMARGVRPQDRPFPLAYTGPSTKRPKVPPPPPQWLVKEVTQNLVSYEDCIAERARRRLDNALQLAERDAKALEVGALHGVHRQRARCGARAAEVRIGPDEYHPTLNKVLQQGYTLDLTDRGRPRIRQLEKLRKEYWGIDARQLLQDARAIQWPDEELLFFLEFGFMDYSGATPPICSYSPHQQKALGNASAFAEKVQQEIASGWIGAATGYPPSIPFQVRPGSLEHKSGGRFRLVWNASWPAPGSRDSAVKIGERWFPVAPNASTSMPPNLEFEWSAIETNNEAFAIMVAAAKATGVRVLGRTFDFTAWFRQLAVATMDRWKCAVHAEGGFREDRRMQMGRRSSAHSGQRTTSLLAALLQKAAGDERWGLRDPCTAASPEEARRRQALQEWLLARSKGQAAGKGSRAPGQESLLYFSTFQDDVTALALGHEAARDASEGVARWLHGRYGVPLSSKEEAARDFAETFTSIGATYDMTNLDSVQCRPREEKMAKYRGMVETLRQGARLVPLLDLQRFARLHTFMARFIQGGELYCNSAYCCLRAVPHTRAELRPVSQQLLRDAEAVLKLLSEERFASLTADPLYSHPGLQGFASDASGATGAGFSGWGVHVEGRIAAGVWSRDIKKALADDQLSISPLELLAAAIALAVASQKPCRWPPGRQLILRSDSDSACAVANSMRADSAPMLEALRILREVLEETGAKVRLQYIPTAENVIADSLSRGRMERAREEVRTQWLIEEVEAPERIRLWCERVHRAAQQAARRTGAGRSPRKSGDRVRQAVSKRRKIGTDLE